MSWKCVGRMNQLIFFLFAFVLTINNPQTKMKKTMLIDLSLLQELFVPRKKTEFIFNFIEKFIRIVSLKKALHQDLTAILFLNC